ncbi:MAG: phenylacetate--CoA ligase family protein [Candidatus Andersenbacteria bacterium]|nr:phenylacetate--CoA ligase family protein [Candidatus Andersenbacteria bacterium]
MANILAINKNADLEPKTTYQDQVLASVWSLAKEAYKKSIYYQQIWEGIWNEASVDWDDFFKLKPADKSLFAIKNVAIKRSNVAYYFLTGDTTGKPKVIPVTKKEWRARNEYRANCYRLAGITKFDSVWIALPFGPWAAGHSAQHAFHILESNVLPAGLSNDQYVMRHIWNQAKQMNINIIATTPSILKFIESSIEEGKLSPIEKVITSGDHVSNELRGYYKDKYGVNLLASYGSSECFMGMECKYQCGYHFDPDRILVEVVDPQNNLPTESEGSVLLTDLTSEAIPIIRYKSGDRGKINYQKCQCGSDWPRLQWTGRDGDYYEISGGVNLHSYQVEQALDGLNPKVQKCDVVIKDDHGGKDLIKFTAFFNAKDVSTQRQKKFLTQKVTQAIRTLSLDFNDVMFEEYAHIAVIIRSIDRDTSQQNRKVEIRDLRKFRSSRV